MFANLVNTVFGISDSLVADITIAVLGVLFVSLIISFFLGFFSSVTYKFFK